MLCRIGSGQLVIRRWYVASRVFMAHASGFSSRHEGSAFGRFSSNAIPFDFADRNLLMVYPHMGFRSTRTPSSTVRLLLCVDV